VEEAATGGQDRRDSRLHGTAGGYDDGVDHDPVRAELASALEGLDVETRQALTRALERGDYELEGGDWGEQDDGSGCLLSLAAWEMGLERGESLMRRSVDAVRVPALFDAWWGDVLEREGDVVRARRTVREALGEMLHRSLAAPVERHPQLPPWRPADRGASRETEPYPTK
jgi:hypothetical protein